MRRFEVNRKVHILVTGGAGFIGSHLTDALVKEGHRVTVVDNLSTGRRSNLNPDAKFHCCDISRPEELDEVFRSDHFDLVYHHAAQMNVRRSVADPAHDATVNIIGLLNVLQCCVRYGVGKVVFASTGGAVYGDQRTFPADEEHVTNPISPYGVAKLSSEKYLFYYHSVFGVHVTILRYANVYGPRQNSAGEAGVVAVFGSTLLNGGTPMINGDGSQTRDFVFVDDVIRANLLALPGEGFHTFNVGTGLETDINAIFEQIRTATGSTGPASHGPRQQGEQLRSVLDFRKIERSLGWRPRISLDEGIEHTVRWFRREAGNNAPT